MNNIPAPEYHYTMKVGLYVFDKFYKLNFILGLFVLRFFNSLMFNELGPQLIFELGFQLIRLYCKQVYRIPGIT